MKVTATIVRRAVRVSRVTSMKSPQDLIDVINAVLADPEVRAQILREETGSGQSSLFGGSRD